MKLKKIASLMLAGIMAVSMLAGCKSGTTPNTDDKPEVTPVAGVAAAINNELDKNKDALSFTEDTSLENVLLAHFASKPIDAAYWDNRAIDNMAGHYAAINGIVKADETAGDVAEMLESKDTDEKTTGLMLFAANQEMFDQASVLKFVGQQIDELELASVNKANKKSYNYTGSVAVVEAESKGGEESIWVIAIEVTKDLADR